jgi:hypothetical protein
MRTLTTRKGKSVNTPLTDEEAMRVLKDAHLDNDFARSLIASAGRLSAEQNTWVHILAMENAIVNFDLPNLMAKLRQAYIDGDKRPSLGGKRWNLYVEETTVRMTVDGDPAGYVDKQDVWWVVGNVDDLILEEILDAEQN